MCGRYTLRVSQGGTGRDYSKSSILFDWSCTVQYRPTQTGRRRACEYATGGAAVVCWKWGLIPSWAKDPKIGSSLINARADTVATKPSFRSAFRKRRCLIAVDGFYEWQAVPGQKTKQPYLIKA